ncbi:MAG: outer membrane protein assembly factor BamD [Rikenellaceae bacterium]
MKQRIYKLIMSLFVAAILGSCGTTSILSNADPETIYEVSMDYYERGKYAKAARCFENVLTYYVGSNLEDSIMFFTAKSKFKDEDYYSAISYFEEYRKRHYRSHLLEDAEGMMTLSYYYTSAGPERDQTGTEMAIASIDEFFSRHPDSDKVDDFRSIREELVQRLYDRSFLNAYTYYKIGYYKSAIVALKNALREYPESSNREKIMYYMIMAAFELADNSIEELENDRHMAVIDMYYTFIAEFPRSQYKKEIDKKVAVSRTFLQTSDPSLLENKGETILSK